MAISIAFFFYSKDIQAVRSQEQKSYFPNLQWNHKWIGSDKNLQKKERTFCLVRRGNKQLYKASVSFDVVAKGFAFYLTCFAIILMFLGMIIGIHSNNSSNNSLYAVAVLFLININDYFQFFLRQIIISQSLLLSYERDLLLA